MSSWLLLRTVLAKMAPQASPKQAGNRVWKGLVKNIVFCGRRRKLGTKLGMQGFNDSAVLGRGAELSLISRRAETLFWHSSNKNILLAYLLLFFLSIQSLLSKTAFPLSGTKVPPKGFRHLRFTPGDDSDDSAQSSHVNINPFTPESYRQMLFLPNGKRKTREEL